MNEMNPCLHGENGVSETGSEQALLGQRLMALRTERHLTQRQVSDYAGINRVTYSLFESGRMAPPQSALVKIAECFGLQPSKLLAE